MYRWLNLVELFYSFWDFHSCVEKFENVPTHLTIKLVSNVYVYIREKIDNMSIAHN